MKKLKSIVRACRICMTVYGDWSADGDRVGILVTRTITLG